LAEQDMKGMHELANFGWRQSHREILWGAARKIETPG
jgi:hypothetical protein